MDMIDENLKKQLDDFLEELDLFLYGGIGMFMPHPHEDEVKERIVVSRLSFGKFKIKYIFKDKVEKEYGFYSIVHKCEYYDSDGNIIQI